MAVLNRQAAPPFQLSQNYNLTPPEVFQLPGEKKLFAYRGLQQDVAKLELIFSAGRWFETKSGVSHFTAQMLSKGTQRRNSFVVAQALESLGAHLEINAGFDVIEISLYALRKNLLTAVEILGEILNVPSFDGSELRLMKEIFVQNLRVNNEKTNVVASKEIRKAIFGEDHPYGGSIEEGDVSDISQDDLIPFFKNNFSLKASFLIGNLSDSEIQTIIQAIPHASLKTPARPGSKIHPGASHSIQKKDSVQTSIRLGRRCIQKSESTDYFDAVMFNHILGGYFGSRLMKNIREEKGLTYGIYSSMNHFLNESFWVIGAEVNQKNADAAVREIKNEIKRLQEEPVSANELDTAKNYFIGSWQSENATLFAVAEKMKSLYLWNQSDTHYTNLLNHIRSITPKQLQETANKFGNEEFFEVSVG